MKKLIGIILLVAFWAFAWWLIEPLLGDDVVNEELKVTDRSVNDTAQPTIEFRNLDADEVALRNEERNSEPVIEVVREEVQEQEARVEVITQPEPAAVIQTPPAPAPAPVQEIEVAKTYFGNFSGAGGSYRASGSVSTDGVNLSIGNLDSTNVPDGFVYLATNDSATDFISLGRLKGNVGNQNYSIPDGVDLEKYDKVLIWCKAFSILVGSADLN